jgi:hypothetical protein
MSGLNPPSGLRLGEQTPAPMGDDIDVILDDISIDPSKNALEVKLPDGSVKINLGSLQQDDDRDSKFDDNLAEKLSDMELAALVDPLITGYEADYESSSDWRADRATAIEMLGFKLEKPGTGTTGEPAGISKVRHPIIAEAVIRGSATARSELLPTDGPVKVRNDDPNATLQSDVRATALEKDMNHYLTTTAVEYYPDTDQMLFSVYLGGCAFKKVYIDPIRNRPVSESVDAENIIVSNAATDIKSALRVTHRSTMRPSMLKRMQILGAYRDCDLQEPVIPVTDTIEQAKEGISGLRKNASSEATDRDYEILEIYCELDIPGFEHKGKNNKPDGLPVPYRVTIEKNSREILEIRRNYDEDDPLCMPKVCIVKFGFLPSFGFYDVGLGQILGNLAMALTAGLREGLDAGMFANFPAGLIAKQGTRQNTMDIRVGPGQFYPIETSGGKIQDSAMALPFKEMGPGMMQLITYMAETAMRLGGAASIQVGEGRSDAPVGTTIALIEQATKPMDAVHKRLVQAQGQEIKLLVDLFRQMPDAIYLDKKLPSRFLEVQAAAGLPTSEDQAVAKQKFKWDRDQFIQALADYDLVPAADPNTSSSVQRAAKAQVIYQMAKDNPAGFDTAEVYKTVFSMLGLSGAEGLLKKQDAPAPPPLKEQAALISAQANMKNAETKSEQVQSDIADTHMDDQNRDLDRQSEEKKAALKFAEAVVTHNAEGQMPNVLNQPGLFPGGLTN